MLDESIMFTVNQKDLTNAGFLPQPRVRGAPLNAKPSRKVLLAGKTNNMLDNPGRYIAIVPVNLEPFFQSYMNAKALSNGTNHRTRYIEKLGIEEKTRKNRREKIKEQLKNAKTKLEEKIRNSNNLASVIMRLQSDPKKQKELLKHEKLTRKITIKNPNLLKLARTIKQAKSAYNANVFNYYKTDKEMIPIIKSNKIKQLKNAKLLSMSNKEINDIVKIIRTKMRQNEAILPG